MLDPIQGILDHPVHIDEPLGLFLHEDLQRLGDLHFAALTLLGEQIAEHVLDLDIHLLHPASREDLHDRNLLIGHLQLHEPLVELSFLQKSPDLLPGILSGFGGRGNLDRPFGGRKRLLVDPAGRPVEGVPISVSWWRPGGPEAQRTTDAEGRATFDGMPGVSLRAYPRWQPSPERPWIAPPAAMVAETTQMELAVAIMLLKRSETLNFLQILVERDEHRQRQDDALDDGLLRGIHPEQDQSVGEHGHDQPLHRLW